MKAEEILLTKDGIKIGNNYKILLCSSLFYFRIPEEEWEDRIKKIKLAGYNCLDVYFPWNYHEVEEGKWLFDGNRNIIKFLNIVRENEMFIIARPGPYICSEWDLGGLPAYLLSKRDIRLREANDVFLGYVEKWYDRIIPIISEYQVTEGGPIIAIQVENELDFYNCSDQKNYLSRLVDFIKKYNINIPLIACAGQGDVEGATGLLESLVPTFNFYPDIKDSTIESKLYYYLDLMRRKNFPFLITETGREHFLLKRLLASGAKLIGAYNQVGGTNYEFYNAINNWGDPLSLITCDYDFNSLVSAFGEINEKEFLEARLLSKLVNSLDDLIATSTIEDNSDIVVESIKGSICPVSKLMNLSGYGKMLSLVNVSQDEASVKINIDKGIFPRSTNLEVKPLQCKYVFINLDLKKWDINGRIIFSSAEPCLINARNNQTIMVFYTPGEKSEVVLEIDEVEMVEGDVDTSNIIVFRFGEEESGKLATITLKNGRELKLIGLDKLSAAKLEGIDENEEPIYLDAFANDAVVYEQNLRDVNVIFENRLNELSYAEKITENDKPMFLEQVGIEKGCGWYKVKFKPTTDKIKGIVVENASDILSVYVNKDFLGTFINGGDFLYLPIETESEEIEVSIKSEIWGHCNFDDVRKPSLRLHSLKGLNGVSLIADIMDITSNWYLYKNADSKHPPVYTNFGVRLTSEKGFKDRYFKEIFIEQDTDNLYLVFKDFQCKGHLYINQRYVDEIDIYHNSLNVTDFIESGAVNKIEVVIEKNYYDESTGKVYMLKGIKNQGCSIMRVSPDDLYRLGTEARERLKKVSLPLLIEKNDAAIVWFESAYKEDYKKIKAIFEGENIKITAIVHNEVIGRIWVDEKISKAFTRRGKPNILYIPKDKLNNNKIMFYVERIKKEEKGVLNSINLKFMQ